MKQKILEQLNIAWQLFEYHCNELDDREAMWCSAPNGLQIRKTENAWTADWPETEAYTIGPPSIAWTKMNCVPVNHADGPLREKVWIPSHCG
jgi:hypothetical protein